uniref:baseplate J/gp47 family protein n=1 Tax=Ruminococcus bromii TaxID=40518 RepID=UPI003FEF8B48
METYDEIYGRMKNAYELETGDSFNEVSDIAIRLKVLAGEIFKLQTNLEWWKRQMFAVSASGECLDKLASQRGIERKKAMKSTGEITFNISQPCSHDIVIPKGCVVATADLVPVRFVTTEDEEISAGNTLVSVYAEAEQAGSNGNIGLGYAVVPVSVPTEIETVTNREKFTGGCDAETDDELRKRIRDTYINTSNGTNAAYYEQLALTVDGVAKASAVGKARGVGTVNVYVTGADASLGTNVVAYAEDGYSSGEVKELLKNAFAEYVNSIPIGGTFRLSELGARLIDTGCITNYNWNTDMQDVTVAKSQCFTVGTVTIGVK